MGLIARSMNYISIFYSDFYSNPFLLAMVQIKQASTHAMQNAMSNKHTMMPPMAWNQQTSSTINTTHWTVHTWHAVISFNSARQLPTASHLTHPSLTTLTTNTSHTQEKYSHTSSYLWIETIHHETEACGITQAVLEPRDAGTSNGC